MRSDLINLDSFRRPWLLKKTPSASPALVRGHTVAIAVGVVICELLCGDLLRTPTPPPLERHGARLG